MSREFRAAEDQVSNARPFARGVEDEEASGDIGSETPSGNCWKSGAHHLSGAGKALVELFNSISVSASGRITG